MKKIIFCAGAFIGATILQAADKAVMDTSASPHVKFEAIGIDSAHWTNGFWADRWEIDRKVTIPSMKHIMERPDNSATFQNFRVAAGEVQGKFRGNPWSDGDCYKWIEAAVSIYAITKDPVLGQQVDEMIGLIEKTMASDGYISTNIQLPSANQKLKSRLWTDEYTSKYLPPEGDKKERWGDVTSHEFYNMGHLITAACIHYRVTGKDNFLKLALRVGDYWCTVFGPKPKELAHMDFNPSNIMAAVELYRTTKDKKYLDLADIFVTMRGSQPGGSDLFQSKVPLRKEVEAVGHGVTSTYLWSGAADVVAETGEPELMASLQRLWEDVANKKMYIHGGISAMHHGESHRDLPFPGTAQKGGAGTTPNTGDLMAVTTRNRSAESKPNSIHESFGMAYELPNRTAYNETCGSIGNAMWSWRMLCLTGEAKYADAMERVFYNGMLSAISLSGDHYFYTNPLRRSAAGVPLLSQDSKERWDRCGTDMPGQIQEST